VANSAPAGYPGPDLNSILIYNPANLASAPTIVTPTGAGSLDGPEQIAVDPADGDLFIASVGATTGIAKIQEYNPSGVYIRTLASVTGGNSYGVAFDINTDIVYASFLNSGTNGTIEKYSAATGADLGLFANGLQNAAYLADIPEPSTALLLAVPALSLMLRRGARRKGFSH
jgi:DNA-binding beta-propeller fold protein YncE